MALQTDPRRVNKPLDWNGEIAPGPRELGFGYSFHIAATVDRVPTVYIRNGRIINLDPADPIQVSYENPAPESPLRSERPGSPTRTCSRIRPTNSTPRPSSMARAASAT